MSALAELAGVRLPSVTDVVARLERDGLVTRSLRSSSRLCCYARGWPAVDRGGAGG
ncbi:hypothetical protein DI005_01885 [Prauserella sp. PE36]|uniref:MarR family transcriptional regulator n=1 Tax=Prauserella endophytica TaxID=1592324 RepID=A0ABY2SCP2_9PSEU|nr:MarR family transcriptional regulator [Prauserella sp. PE36]RBM23717.1 hypothetical protein DI005_01885 [Prauserella sp. PE36]TKG73276.1 MarR family transcriptional regulator [Prauserella endophytica]